MKTLGNEVVSGFVLFLRGFGNFVVWRRNRVDGLFCFVAPEPKAGNYVHCHFIVVKLLKLGVCVTLKRSTRINCELV